MGKIKVIALDAERSIRTAAAPFFMIIWTAVFLAVIASGLAGCGCETKKETVYVQVPVEAAPSGVKIAILSDDTQEVQFFLNEDGTLRHIDGNTFKIFPADVKKVVFCSDKVGWFENSRIFGQFDENLKVKFSGMVNNDEGEFYVILKDDRKFEVVMDRQVVTYRPMEVKVYSSNWYEYGKQLYSEGEMRLAADGNGVMVKFKMGCNQIVGSADYRAWTPTMTITFAPSNDGEAMSVPIQKDEEGNLYTEELYIPFTEQNGYGNIIYNKKLRGRFMYVDKEGWTSQMNFSPRDGSFAWWLHAEGMNLSQEYKDGMVEVTYQPSYY